MTKQTEQSEPFDPADHTVAEVDEYLAGVDEAERDRVLAAERAGKDRAGVAALAPDQADQTPGQDPGPPAADEERPGSEEVLAVPEVTEEPVRRDGWVLTDYGWKPDTGAGPAGLPPGSGTPDNPTPAGHRPDAADTADTATREGRDD